MPCWVTQVANVGCNDERISFHIRSAPPPPEWMKPTFDASSWMRQRLPLMIGKTVAVHTGKDFNEVTIQPEMVGRYLGEFAMTRGEVKHTGPGVGATRSSKYLPLK